ncbi:MAG: putative toxin-antitoxin system toxin component, PIN family [Deltaproteobacteria bacterium]|nr:MAG: putative toxin-antitoxin system toxin component, PIN family [Deltaproteobacteria bacterium]
MPKAVLDTNVIVSAFLKPESNAALILSLFFEGFLTVCLSQEILAEYKEVLKREKFRKLDQGIISNFLEEIGRQALMVDPRVSINAAIVDPDDNKFLECALESKADYLITGNTRHFPFKKFRATQIINPRDFIDLLGEAIIQNQESKDLER